MAIESQPDGSPDGSTKIAGENGKVVPNLTDYGTPFDTLKTARQFIQFAIDPSKGLTRRRYGWHSNNTLFDATNISADDANGVLDLSTTATGTDTARIRSALVGQYVSQAMAQPGIGAHIADANVDITDGLASLSHGQIAIGAGWHDGGSGGWGVGGPVQTFIGVLFDSDGANVVLISNGSHAGGGPIAQEDWNMDVMDGSGNQDNPSGQTLHPENGYIWNFPYTWYAYGALYVGVIDPVTDRPIYFHKFNIDGASLDRPNLAPMVIVDNGGTATALDMSVGGMQFTLYGAHLSEEGGEERGLEVARTGLTIGTNVTTNNNAPDPQAEAGDPIIAFRRESGVRDLEVRMDEIIVTPDNDIWLFAWDEYGDPTSALTGQNFREPHAVANSSETKIEVDTQATAYSPDTAVFRGMDYTQTDKNKASLAQIATDDRLPIDATRIYTAVETGTDAALSPAQFRIVEGF